MLFVTGQFKGKPVEMQLVSAEDLLKEFGIKKKERFAFKYHDHAKSYDSLNKVEKKPSRTGPGPEFRGIHPQGGEITVFYANRKPTTDPKTGHFRKNPNNVWFTDNLLLKWNENSDLIAWFLLHPMCADSPLRQKNAKCTWMLDDREAKAQRDFDRMSESMELMASIAQETNELKLRRIAFGLKGKLKVRGSAKMGIKELKAALGMLAQRYPEDFAHAYKDTFTLMRGIIDYAIASGLTRTKGIGGGQSAVLWRNDINDGALICNVPSNTNVTDFLVGYLSDETRFSIFIDTVNRELGSKDIEKLAPLMTAGPKEVKDMSAIELVAKAISEEVIQYRHGEGVVILNDFVPEEPVLHKVQNAAKWREELREAIEKVDIKRNRLKKRLINGPAKPVESEEGLTKTEANDDSGTKNAEGASTKKK